MLLGLITGYTFLHWLIFVDLELFQLNKKITDFVIPIVLTGILNLFILRPRFKILKLDTKRGSWSDFYTIMLWMAMATPIIIAQKYIVSATGKLTELKSINEINKFENSKYYILNDYYIDKNVIGIHSELDVNDRFSDNFNMHIYFSVPIYEKESDTLNAVPSAWLGVKYQEKIGNDLESRRKKKIYQFFLNHSLKKFNNKNISDFVYLNRLRDSEKRKGFIDAIKSTPIYTPNAIVLEAVNEQFENRNGNKLAWIFGSALICSFIWIIMLMIPKIDEQQLNRILDDSKEK